MSPRDDPIVVQNNLDEVVSGSGEGEEADVVSNLSSNTSKMESSLGAFSEYSRVRSTRSAMTHLQTESNYKNEMKSRKMMAKLNKLKRK